MIFLQILDEILDNGYPLCTEMNVLQDLIKPPNFLRSLKNHVTGETNISNVLPTGQLSVGCFLFKNSYSLLDHFYFGMSRSSLVSKFVNIFFNYRSLNLIFLIRMFLGVEQTLNMQIMKLILM